MFFIPGLYVAAVHVPSNAEFVSGTMAHPVQVWSAQTPEEGV